MKKILLLGGSAQQVVAIETAKKRGLYTILCDYLDDNPGQYIADKFYLVSTTNKEKVLEIAKKEKISGILAYASDPAAPTAAYVAEKLDLSGNPYTAVETLCNKDKFRAFLQKNKFFIPHAKGYVSEEGAYCDIQNGFYRFPIILKPVDSSGSKGISVLQTMENLEQAIQFAFSFSRSRRIVIEEFVEKKHPYLVGGDIFIVNGKIVLWGLLNCHRNNQVNPLVPIGKSFPLQMDEINVWKIKNTLQMLVDKLGIRDGEMNVELVINKQDEVCLIDVGPRSGGNLIPELLGEIYNVDLVEWSIKVAMGESLDVNNVKNGNVCYASYNLHSEREGVLEDIKYSSKIKQYIIQKLIYKKKGDRVEYFDNATKVIGVIFMKFQNENEMKFILKNIGKHIQIVYKN